MKIAIGIPISRLFDWRAILAQMYAMRDMLGLGHSVQFMVEGNHERPLPIVQARNEIALRAMGAGADFLLWLDSDATGTPGMLARLLERDLPIVSALCFKRKYPVSPACGRKNTDPDAPDSSHPSPVDDVAEWVKGSGNLQNTTSAILLPDREGALLPVDVVGTHYTLIKRAVVERLPQPWYKRTTPPDWGSTGSDWYFCMQATAAGFPVFVDMTAISGHLEGSHEIAVHDFVAWTMATKLSEYKREQQGEK